MKSLGNGTEIASKTTKTANFSTTQGQFEAFFFYKLNLSRHESSPEQQVSSCMGVSTIYSTKSIDVLTKVNKNIKNRKIFEVLSFLMSIPDPTDPLKHSNP